ncbi:ribonuclease VapC [Oxyplasma meridianum]|uniref:Ribonuclease VapC n=1 Tax=Oxyplasma meridianum TaxID=3073602 RepID=A0AAX4NHQ9_9ARCH
MTVYILDTGAIISRNINLISGNICIPVSVMGEIRKGKLKRNMDEISEYISVIDPSHNFKKLVRKAAEETGDIRVLSETDIDVISAALEISGIIVSDDYAIQNVAGKMGIKYIGVEKETIKKQMEWQFRCTGCRKIYSKFVPVCEICGHAVKRFPK